MGGANAGKGKYVPPHKRGGAQPGAAAAGAGAGRYVPPHLRAGAAAAPAAGFDPNAPTASSFIVGKGFKKGASGYYYPNAATRPHIHVYIDSKGATDFTCLTMVALSSTVSGATGKDAGLTVKGTHALAHNAYNQKRVDERLALCSVDTKKMWYEVLANM